MKKYLLTMLFLFCAAGALIAQPANCVNPQAITVPFVKDGSGEFCFVSTCMGSTINSWNMTRLEINGVDYTNKYADGVYAGGQWPAPINGNYYIYYKAQYAWSHFEMKGACSVATTVPTTIPAITPTAGPIVTPAATPSEAPAVTPTPFIIIEYGNVWLTPATQAVSTGDSFSIEIHANTGSAILGAFGFTVSYPTNLMSLSSISEITSGLSLTTNTTETGRIVIAGFNANGIPGSTDLALVRIFFNASSAAAGTGAINLTVQNLNDINGSVIGSPSGTGAYVTIHSGETIAPTEMPTMDATAVPTQEPTVEPTATPTASPTAEPTIVPTIPPGIGQCWISPLTQIINPGSVTIQINVDTENYDIGAFGFTIKYPSALLTYSSISEITPGLNLTVGTSAAGNIVMAGFNANGIPGGTDVALVQITLTSRTDVLGTAVIELKVNTLADTSGNTIGTLSALGGSIEIVNDPSITPAPEITPTIAPTLAPTVGPTQVPTPVVSQAPTLVPTSVPTPVPTVEPTVGPTPLPGAGKLAFYPDTVSVNQGERTVVELHANCGDQNLGAFGFKGEYPGNLLTLVSIEEIASGLNLASNINTPGYFAVAGFNPNQNGVPGSTDLSLVRITFEGSFTEIGNGVISLTVNTLVDPTVTVIGTPTGGTCSFTVNPGPTGEVTVAPTVGPTANPTLAPAIVPTLEPSVIPTPVPTMIPGTGQVWLNPASQTVNAGASHSIDIHVNSGNQDIGAFGFTISFPANLLMYNGSSEIASGINLVTNSTPSGTMMMAGFNASGIKGSTDLALARMNFTALNNSGETGNISITVTTLVDPSANTIGTPSGTGCSVTVACGIQCNITPVPTAEPTAAPTPAPTFMPGAGQVWLSPASQSVSGGSPVTLEIHANTGSSRLGAFGFTVTYPSAMFIMVNYSEIVSGLNLVHNYDGTSGIIIISGFNANGVDAGTDIALIRVNLSALSSALGSANIGFTVQTLADNTGITIGSPIGTGASVTVTACGNCATSAPTVAPTVAPAPTEVQMLGSGSA